MGKDMIIEILKSQLEAANATILTMSEEMKSMRRSFEATISDLRKTIANLESLLQERDSSLDKAANELRGMKAVAFPKSEKQKTPASPKTEEEKAAEKQRREDAVKARGNNGARHKEHFEMETVEKDVYPEDVDKDLCVEVGVRYATRYSMIPPRFIKTIYKLHALKKDDIIYSDKAPMTPLLNSCYDGSFVAGIAELRYLYAMPVERIVKYFRSHGFDLDKGTAHGLLAKTSDLVDKLYEAMGAAVKEDSYLNCDETYHRVLVEATGNDGKGSKKAFIWVIVAAHTGLTYFFYDDGSRSQEVILNELKGYSGLVQSDGLRAYKNLAAGSGGKIVRLACLQHCKREFLDDSLKGNQDAQEIIEQSNLLYHNEHQHKIGEGGWTVEDNLKWRRAYAPPILARLKTALTRVRDDMTKYPPKSLMHKAANYFLNEWDGIEAIASYGDVAWDNNLIERTNRHVSASRHSSLFFGSHEGAQRGCKYFSLACTCQNLGINFFDYFSDILGKCAAMPNGAPPEAYRNLLPDRWTKE